MGNGRPKFNHIKNYSKCKWSNIPIERQRLTDLFGMHNPIYVSTRVMKWNKVKVAQLCPTLWDPMNYRVHGLLQARILEWVAVPSPRDRTQGSSLQAESLPAEPQGKPKNTGVGSLFFFQQIFSTQEWEMERGSSALQADSLPTELSGTQYKITDRLKV